MKKTQQVYLAMFNLRLIQLLTFIPVDMFFLTHFQTLYNIYAKAILLLIPLTYLETADYNFFMSEEEMIYYLRDDKDDKKQQEINQMKFEEEMQQKEGKYIKSKNKGEKKGILKEISPSNIPYPNKYSKNLGDILKKKISPILKDTCKYNCLFVTTLDIHGRAVELRYYLNNSIMHVYEAEEIYDSMNHLLAEKDMIVKGKKVFFNTVEVSLHEVRDVFNAPLRKNNSMNSTSSSASLAGLSNESKSNLTNLGKTQSTSQLINEHSKHRKRGLRHRHSMRSLRSTSQYEFSSAKQRSANISKASLLSSAASSTIFSNPLNEVEELLPPSSNNLSRSNLNKNMRKTTSSLFDQSILNDQRLLENIHSINETIMNAPKVQKVIAKRERRLSEAKVKEGRFKKEMNRIKKINHGETEDENEEDEGISNGISKNEEKMGDNDNNDNNTSNIQENKENNKISNENNNKNKDENKDEKNNGNNNGNNNKNNDNNRDNKDGNEIKNNEKSTPAPLTSKQKDLNILNTLLARIEKENKEERLEKEKEEREKEEKEEKEKAEKEKQEKEANTEEATEPNDKKKSKHKHRKDGQSMDGEDTDSEDDEDEEDDENAYDDYSSTESGSSTESSGYGYDARPDDKYTISQDFSIRNTLPHSPEQNREGKGKHKKRNNNANTFIPNQPTTPPKERTDEDEFIDFILYHTDVAKIKSPEKPNITENTVSNSPIKNNSQPIANSPPPLNRRMSSTQDITSQSIQYHISHMPITGIARNYKKKTKKDELLDQLNSFYQKGDSSDGDLDFDPIHSQSHSKPNNNQRPGTSTNAGDQNNNNNNFIIFNSLNSPQKKKKVTILDDIKKINK